MSKSEHPDHATPNGMQYPTNNIVALFASREAAEAASPRSSPQDSRRVMSPSSTAPDGLR